MMQCYCFRSCATDALHDVAKWLNGEGMIAVRDIWFRTSLLNAIFASFIDWYY